MTHMYAHVQNVMVLAWPPSLMRVMNSFFCYSCAWIYFLFAMSKVKLHATSSEKAKEILLNGDCKIAFPPFEPERQKVWYIV